MWWEPNYISLPSQGNRSLNISWLGLVMQCYWLEDYSQMIGVQALLINKHKFKGLLPGCVHGWVKAGSSFPWCFPEFWRDPSLVLSVTLLALQPCWPCSPAGLGVMWDRMVLPSIQLFVGSVTASFLTMEHLLPWGKSGSLPTRVRQSMIREFCTWKLLALRSHPTHEPSEWLDMALWARHPRWWGLPFLRSKGRGRVSCLLLPAVHHFEFISSVGVCKYKRRWMTWLWDQEFPLPPLWSCLLSEKYSWVTVPL